MITVKDMKEMLAKYPDNMVLLHSSDEEGNEISFLNAVEDVNFKVHGGEIQTGITLEELTPEMRKVGFTEEDVLKDGQPGLILYP